MLNTEKVEKILSGIVTQEDLKRRYKCGLSISKIALMLNVSTPTAREIIIFTGAEIRKKPVAKIKNNTYPARFTDEDINFEEEIKTRIFN